LLKNPTDVAPVDHTKIRHDVTFISVDVETQGNMTVYNFLQDFGNRKHCLYIEYPVEKLMRYRELCIDGQNPSKFFQNQSHSVLFLFSNYLRTNLWSTHNPTPAHLSLQSRVTGHSYGAKYSCWLTGSPGLFSLTNSF
jgi:hypothetical protein